MSKAFFVDTQCMQHYRVRAMPAPVRHLLKWTFPPTRSLQRDHCLLHEPLSWGRSSCPALGSIRQQ